MPIPKRVRMKSPKLNPPTWTSNRYQDVRVTPQMRPTQTTGLIEMRIRPFQVLAASPQQGQPAHATDAPAIRIHRVAGRRLLLPAAPAAIRFRDVGPQVEGRKIDQHLIAVIPLLGHHLIDHGGVPVRHGRPPLRELRPRP